VRLVVKVGGSLLTDPGLLHKIVAQLVHLRGRGIQIIVVHGGGKQIKYYLEQLRISTQFHKGLRVTDTDTMQVVQMVLAGLVNKNIVGAFSNMNCRAVGMCGADGRSFLAQKYWDPQEVNEPFDYGQVGEISQGDPALINLLLKHDYFPVIACMGIGVDGTYYNINGDEMAAAVAVACHADQLIFLTDVPGIFDARKRVIPNLNSHELEQLRSQGIISEGMFPKTRACEQALREGLTQIHIIGGQEQNCLLRVLVENEKLGTAVH